VGREGRGDVPAGRMVLSHVRARGGKSGREGGGRRLPGLGVD